MRFDLIFAECHLWGDLRNRRLLCILFIAVLSNWLWKTESHNFWVLLEHLNFILYHRRLSPVTRLFLDLWIDSFRNIDSKTKIGRTLRTRIAPVLKIFDHHVVLSNELNVHFLDLYSINMVVFHNFELLCRIVGRWWLYHPPILSFLLKLEVFEVNVLGRRANTDVQVSRRGNGMLRLHRVIDWWYANSW